MPVNKYCVCLLWDVKLKRLVLDHQSFPNPDKDPQAKMKCREKAQALRKAGCQNVQPVVITGIREDAEWDTLCDRLTHMNWHFGCGDVIHVEIESSTTTGFRGHVTRRMHHAGEDKRVFRVDGDVLRFLDHRSLLSKPFHI